MYNLLIMVKVTSAASYVLGDLPTASYTYNDISLTHHVSGNGMHFFVLLTMLYVGIKVLIELLAQSLLCEH